MEKVVKRFNFARYNLLFMSVIAFVSVVLHIFKPEVFLEYSDKVKVQTDNEAFEI